jgi:uncharacterized damage-inducible protein DinB
MIRPSYAAMMAVYNRRMNARIYASAARLDDAVRRCDQGAFWRSIHATLCHLLWADEMWMSRLDGWDRPRANLADSGDDVESFETLTIGRHQADVRLAAWADRLDDQALAAPLTWFSGAANMMMTADRAALVVHLFNHQTHHRGQVHAMLTRAGERPGDTDLWLVMAEAD